MPRPNSNFKAKNPIGIFDSGIGGLTVAHAISKEIPDEKLIYFGDTAHLPYGDKSPDSIKYYAIRVSQLLIQKKCKLIVIACNTASALAYETIKDFVGSQALVVNVIDPVVSEVVSRKHTARIGVIGTKGTVKSDVYAQKIRKKSTALEVDSLATPLLVGMIEEGFFNNKISRTIIADYLSRARLKKIDTLILACTHFPLIKPEIEEFYKGKVKIIDSAGVVARHVHVLLKKKHLINPQKNPAHQFFVSDFTKSFEKSTRIFFGKKIKLEELGIWK